MWSSQHTEPFLSNFQKDSMSAKTAFTNYIGRELSWMKRTTSKGGSYKLQKLYMSFRGCTDGASPGRQFRTISLICSAWYTSSDTHRGLSMNAGTSTSTNQWNSQIKTSMKCWGQSSRESSSEGPNNPRTNSAILSLRFLPKYQGLKSCKWMKNRDSSMTAFMRAAEAPSKIYNAKAYSKLNTCKSLKYSWDWDKFAAILSSITLPPNS